MTFCGSRQKLLLHHIKQVYGANSKGTGQSFNIFISKYLEFYLAYCFKNSFHVCLRRNGVVYNMEFRQNSCGYFSPTTSWLAHGCKNLQVLYIILNNFLSIVPEFVVHPLSYELEWWLRSECVFSRHIQIINKTNCLYFCTSRSILIFGFSFEVAFNYPLCVL